VLKGDLIFADEEGVPRGHPQALTLVTLGYFLGRSENVFGARVALGGGKWSAEGVEEAAFKGAADVEASSPSAGIRASTQCPYSEVTCHHDSLTHQGLLRRPPFCLASRGHATCLWPLHLHIVL
jgi:hypothetical protein